MTMIFIILLIITTMIGVGTAVAVEPNAVIMMVGAVRKTTDSQLVVAKMMVITLNHMNMQNQP